MRYLRKLLSSAYGEYALKWHLALVTNFTVLHNDVEVGSNPSVVKTKTLTSKRWHFLPSRTVIAIRLKLRSIHCHGGGRSTCLHERHIVLAASPVPVPNVFIGGERSASRGRGLARTLACTGGGFRDTIVRSSEGPRGARPK